jgi:CubicO group peptidase (beta-lactamase class C family)
LRLAVAFLLAFSAALAQSGPKVVFPRPERILDWAPQERPIGFQSMQKVAPGNWVKRGQSVQALRYAGAELEVSYAHDGRTWDTTTFMEENNVAGILIVKDGRVLMERYALGFSESSLWTSFSVAKSFTSTLLGAAIADGHIGSVDDAVVRYLPALKNSAYDGVTIRQILNMTSGVKWNEDYGDPNSDVNTAHRATDATLGGSPLVTYLARLPREAEPGTKWVYKTAETDLVGEIVMAATRKPLAQYLSEKIWSKLGMEQDAFWMTRAGKELGGCCLSVGLRDYARFGMFILNGAENVVPKTWIDEASRPSPASVRDDPRRGYGFQWWISPGAMAARGIFGQSVLIRPAEKLVIVTLSAWPSATDRKRGAAVAAFQQASIESAATAR